MFFYRCYVSSDMPFGPYENFEECVEDNRDKEDPEGFCSWLEERLKDD